MALQIETIGFKRDYGQSFELRTKSGGFAGIISERFNTGLFKVHFNSTATRSSSRKFRSLVEAVEFIYQRRLKRGWAV